MQQMRIDQLPGKHAMMLFQPAHGAHITPGGSYLIACCIQKVVSLLAATNLLGPRMLCVCLLDLSFLDRLEP